MKIILLRHGEAVDDKLTEDGLKQIDFAVMNLKNERIAKVYYSPLQRTKQTAFLVCEKLGIDNLVEDDRIRERDHFLESSELDYDVFDKNYLNPNFSHKRPEGCKEFSIRVFDFLNDITTRHSENNETVLVVGHSCLIYGFNAYFDGFNKDEMMSWVKMGNCCTVSYLTK